MNRITGQAYQITMLESLYFEACVCIDLPHISVKYLTKKT